MAQSYFSCCNKSCTVGLVPFYVPWKIQQLCALSVSAPLCSAPLGSSWQYGVLCLGIGIRIFLHGYRPEVGAHCAPLVGLHQPGGRVRIGLPWQHWKQAPCPSLRCTLSDDLKDPFAHTHSHSLTQTHTSICWLTLDLSHNTKKDTWKRSLPVAEVTDFYFYFLAKIIQ